jgi:hypothetical protein
MIIILFEYVPFFLDCEWIGVLFDRSLRTLNAMHPRYLFFNQDQPVAFRKSYFAHK